MIGCEEGNESENENESRSYELSGMSEVECMGVGEILEK